MDISVIIPAYNREKYICKCIESILNQTYLPKEIIIVDDGSKDETVSIVRKMESSIVRVIELGQNMGAQAARNRGILEAKYNWIAFCDSDDFWKADKLEKQVKSYQKNHRSVIAGGAEVLKDGITTQRWVNGKSGYIYEEILSNKVYLLFPTILVKKECLIEIGLLDEKVSAYQEWDTAIRLAQKYEIEYINEPLFTYNCHKDATISTDKKRHIMSKRYLFNKYIDSIEEACSTYVLFYWYTMVAHTYSIINSKYWRYRIKSIVYRVKSLLLC